jgi:hypothetical protein
MPLVVMGNAVVMADTRRAYVVRAAGSLSHVGEVYRTYPYTLRGLTDALDDARYQSYAGTPQLVVRLVGRERLVIRRYEGGREVPVSPPSHDEPGATLRPAAPGWASHRGPAVPAPAG